MAQLEIPPKGTRGASFPKWLMRLFGPLMRREFAAYRQKRGNVMRNRLPTVLLTTTGTKSGERRSVIVNRFPDGNSTSSVLVTATAAGAAAHPAWFINLARNADKVWVELDGPEVRVTPELLRGAERSAAWASIEAVAPSFKSYPTKTDREIPVVRLTPTPVE